MPVYVRRPQPVEAVLWRGDNIDELVAVFGDRVRSDGGSMLMVAAGWNGDLGWVPAPVGNWVLRRLSDPTNLWPLDPKSFKARYQPEGG